MTGCNTIEHNTAGAVESAAATETNYTALDRTLSVGIDALKALRDNPGQSADVFLNRFKLASEPVSDAAEKLEDSRADLREYGDKHIALLHAEASKFTDPDLTKRVDADAEKLRGYYSDYDKASAGLSAPLAKAKGYFADIQRVLDLDHSAAGVSQSLGTLDKAIAALKDAKSEIPGSRDALAKLRKNQPKPPIK